MLLLIVFLPSKANRSSFIFFIFVIHLNIFNKQERRVTERKKKKKKRKQQKHVEAYQSVTYFVLKSLQKVSTIKALNIKLII